MAIVNGANCFHKIVEEFVRRPEKGAVNAADLIAVAKQQFDEAGLPEDTRALGGGALSAWLTLSFAMSSNVRT